MKQCTKGLTLKTLVTFIMMAFVQTVLFAQDEASGTGSSTTTTTTKSVVSESNWFASPWVWVVGAAVFILLLVALLRGGSSSRSERITVTKSSSAD